MLRRLILPIAIFSLLAAALLPLPALAGGWTVSTLDSLPGDVITGEPTTIGFMVRQHGKTPWLEGPVAVHAIHQQSRKELTFPAQPEGEAGHYVAELVFDQPGAWKWGIETGLYPEVQWMPDLEVLASTPGDPQATANVGPPIFTGGISLLATILALLWLLRQRSTRRPLGWSAILALLLLLAGGMGLARFAQEANAARAAATLSSQGSTRSSIQDPVVHGEALFVAKGCIICHENRNIRAQTGLFTDDKIPDLTKYSADPDYLRTWLKDPAAVKAKTAMPDLGLKETEIEALIAFLNTEPEN